MLVPTIFIIVLAVSLSRLARRRGVSSTKPLLVSLGTYLVFVIATAGLIKVRSMEDMGPALLGGLAMYGVVFTIILVAARAWINGAGDREDALREPTRSVPEDPMIVNAGSGEGT